MKSVLNPLPLYKESFYVRGKDSAHRPVLDYHQTGMTKSHFDFTAFFHIRCMRHIIGNLIYCLMPIWPMGNGVYGDIQSQEFLMSGHICGQWIPWGWCWQPRK